MRATQPLAIYRYQSDSLIDCAELLVNETGGRRAYLHAREGASSEALRSAKQKLREQGYKCVPTVQNGKPVLEVRGFEKDQDLLEAFTTHRLGLGAPAVTDDPEEARSRTQKAMSHTLQLAGASYNVGDVAYLAYTIMGYLHDKKLPQEKTFFNQNFFNRLHIAGGVGYGLGSIALTRYGGRDQSTNFISSANQKISGYLRKEGVEVEEGSTLYAETHEPKKGFFKSIAAQVAKYPSETLNSIYVFVGAALATAAFYKATREIPKDLLGERLGAALKDRRDEWWDVGLGGVTMASAIAGLTIREKKPVEGEERKGFGRILDWIQEKPLRATGYGYMVATLLHAKGTWNKYQSGDAMVRKTAPLRGIFVVSNLLSEVMLAISSKGHGVGVRPDPSVEQTVIASAAELVMRQPAEKREKLIENLAGYMSSREVLDVKAEEIAGYLRAHIDLLDDNPWTRHYLAPDTPRQATQSMPAATTPLPASNDNGIPKAKITHATQHEKMQPELELATIR